MNTLYILFNIHLILFCHQNKHLNITAIEMDSLNIHSFEFIHTFTFNLIQFLLFTKIQQM